MVKVSFNGFSKELPTFLGALAKNNKRDWFEANRDTYQTHFVEPAKDFVAAMVPAMARLAKGTLAEPRINGSIWRINRDTRFSKDKTPYKAHLSLVFPHGPTFDRKHPAFYFRMNATRLFLGAGAWGFEPPVLERYRQAVADPKKGGALVRAIADVEKAGPWHLNEPHYKNVPRGFDKEMERAWLLKYKGLHIGGDMALPDELFTADAVDFVVDQYRGLKPIQVWLVKALS